MEASELTDSELHFLSRHRYGPKDVFDGRGQYQWAWKQAAKAAGMNLVLGNPCGKGGHRLRTRAGHCAQCDPKKLAFLERHTAEQWVYIAGSREKQLIKIGTCSALGQREAQLCAERYGGARDWILVYWVKVANAGAIEYAAHARLKRFAVARPYWKDNVEQMATELLKCPFSRAFEALTASIGDAPTSEEFTYHSTNLYEFT